MALNRSQALCEHMLERQDVKILVGTDIALDQASQLITRVAADFVSAGFVAGDKLYIRGATAVADDVEALVAEVAAGTLTLPAGTLTTGEVAGAKITLAASDGGAWIDVFNGGKLTFFSGTKPASADADKGGATALVEFAGIEFSAATWNAVTAQATLALTASVSATAAATGTMEWFRLTAPGEERDAASTTARRMDGTIGVGTGDMRVASLSVTSGDPMDLTTFSLILGRAD